VNSGGFLKVSAVTVPQLEGCVIEVTTDFEHQVNCRVLEYWQSLCERTPDIGPQVSNFEITDIIECAPYLIYKDVIDSGYDFRNRYWGTKIVSAFSLEATGKTFRVYYEGKALEQVLEVANFVISKVHSVKMLGQLDFAPGNKFRQFESISVPLFDETGTASRLVGAYDFY